MKKIALLVVLGCLILPSIAYGDNTTCDAATLLVPDGSPHDGAFTGTESRWFRFPARADRSYAIMVENMSAADWAFLVTTYWIYSNCTDGALPTGSLISPIASSEPASYDGITGAGRWALMTGGSFTAFFKITGVAAGHQFCIRVEDTTQINTFFSTYSGFNTYYRLANTTNQTLTVRLKMVNDAGSVVKDTTFSISANRSAPTRNTTAGDLNIPANTGGFTLFMHNGPPGALALDGFLMQGTIVLPIKIVDARQRR
jgi:hypothetical protein